VGDAKSIAVTFSTGKDVLNAYWGFLSNGGLVIQDASGLREGERVRLRVTIESSKKMYELKGQVVRRPDFSSPGESVQALIDRAVIEFNPGEPHDLLLSAAWAETDNVPARKHRRYPADRKVELRVSGREDAGSGRVLNISMGGCCVHLATAPSGLAAGAQVNVAYHGQTVAGVVRWSRADDLGIEFDTPGTEESTVADFVRRFL
jgi:hypothetical protein